jgi:hypothetical protein
MVVTEGIRVIPSTEYRCPRPTFALLISISPVSTGCVCVSMLIAVLFSF